MWEEEEAQGGEGERQTGLTGSMSSSAVGWNSPSSLAANRCSSGYLVSRPACRSRGKAREGLSTTTVPYVAFQPS